MVRERRPRAREQAGHPSADPRVAGADRVHHRPRVYQTIHLLHRAEQPHAVRSAREEDLRGGRQGPQGAEPLGRGGPGVQPGEIPLLRKPGGPQPARLP